MSRVVGRAALVEAVRAHLEGGRAVALHGPTGIGKSALLDELESRAAAQGVRVLRAAGARTERDLSYAALQDLLDQAGPVGPFHQDAVHRTWLGILRGLADDGPVLVLIDDAQWIDKASADALYYAGRRLADRVGFVVTVGPGGRRLLGVPGLVDVDVPALDCGDIIELLALHGLSADVAHRVAAQAGGLPSLALALGGAIGDQPSVLGRPTPMPPTVERMLRDRLEAQSPAVRTTLLYAALMRCPTVRQVARAGRDDAEAELRAAAQAGLVAVTEQSIRFTPPGLARLTVERVDAGTRAHLHQALATAAETPETQVRHEALAATRPDRGLATRLAAGAAVADRNGCRELAAELYLLSAERATVDQSAERVEWLASAIEIGAVGNHADLVYGALDAFLGAGATPAQRVRVRLALVELAGTGRSMMEEVLATALADAACDPALVAGVLLQKARVLLMESRPREAERHAAEAVTLLAGEEEALATALPILAVCRRWLGHGDHDAVLRLALELPEPSLPGLQHTSPRYIAARFAFYDDRLEEAWSEQVALLASLDRGAGVDQVHVLRCLVETAAKMGRAPEAMAYAARALAIASDYDLDPHTGWYISAVAELVGGDVFRARALADRGIAACDERGDTRYLQRLLVVHGQAALRASDAQQAVASLEQVRALEAEHGISDPTVNRWQADLVSALVATGELDRAAEVLDEARKALVARTGGTGVNAQLDRAEAELLISQGELDEACGLVDQSAMACAELSLRIDLGRAFLVRAHLERRRRRVAASRAALDAAATLFSSLRARPWLAGATHELTAPPTVDRLTDTEGRIAREVADGASNREIAERMFLSIKTVEATLTRIYRKLGIRSRTQLATLMPPR
jgi:DNA-binding CsgD family transcriptional regulator/tetratricopeptide (TPR) repeat protein